MAPPVHSHINVSSIAPNIYKADLARELCIGSVPNGGYVAAVMMNAVSQHLKANGQPDTLQAHFQFLKATRIGPAYVVVKDVKLGRNNSVVHVSLHQEDMLPCAPWIDSSAKADGEIVAYVTNTNLAKERGLTLPTEWTLQNTPPPRPADLASLPNDPNWKVYRIPLMERANPIKTIEHYCPAAGFANRATLDFWICCISGERFTNSLLGLVVDASAPFVIESFRQQSDETPVDNDQVPLNQIFWYPTLTMSLDVKKRLPEQGSTWLQIRVASKQIRNGRCDYEIVVLDESGDLVALSSHVALAVDASKNKNKKPAKQEKL